MTGDTGQNDTDFTFDPAEADSAYRPFPGFSDWSAEVPDSSLWDEGHESLVELREGAGPDQLDEAMSFVMRMAAIDTGAIEGLYDVDRGFTYSVAAQAATWEASMDERGPQTRLLFQAQ